ncbi:hypothetical protein HNQ50_001919 [Silvimonas terrae]|uniref:Immunity protein 35 domain-containing protein n=1 Tax=Silvimonas terrae TaxID=300266 RepID=A0A840RFQ5_9NEIS|nr:YrhB domain-containing protein [Silvimonas terrae]MBB5191196.1 hypothetical protein [Silvimonas terrae]
MSRTAETAKKAAECFLQGDLADMASEVSIIDAQTQEFPAGWVYFYQASKFLETNDVHYALVGNAPVFIPRAAGAGWFLNYHRSLDEAMSAYEYCGDPNALANAEIDLLGWRADAEKIQATQIVRAKSGWPLGASKQAIDSCLDRHRVKIPMTSVAAAQECVSELDRIGFNATVSYGK